MAFRLPQVHILSVREVSIRGPFISALLLTAYSYVLFPAGNRAFQLDLLKSTLSTIKEGGNTLNQMRVQGSVFPTPQLMHMYTSLRRERSQRDWQHQWVTYVLSYPSLPSSNPALDWGGVEQGK